MMASDEDVQSERLLRVMLRLAQQINALARTQSMILGHLQELHDGSNSCITKPAIDFAPTALVEPTILDSPFVFKPDSVDCTDVAATVSPRDILPQPFSPRILVARIRAVLRRTKYREEKESASRITIHDIDIDVPRHEVRCDGELLSLSATEFSILCFLAKNPGWVFSRRKIISVVKGDDYPVTERSVDVQILGLRKKLGDCGNVIETVRGFGYRLKED